jgi:acyl carrier protein phosphodiesterase
MGIRNHRRIDTFTDAHPAWQRSRDRFVPPARRFAGIAVDLMYDHYLATRWADYHPATLPQYTQGVYAGLRAYSHLFPPRLERIFPSLSEHDWLASYVKFENIERALTRMSGRTARSAGLLHTVEQARPLYDDMRGDFEWFFPDLVEYALGLRNND